MKPLSAAVAISLATALLGCAEPGAVVQVRNSQDLARALAQAKPGTRIELAAGEYASGVYYVGLRGEAEKPVVIAAADPKNPPVIRGGGAGIHLVDPAYVEIRDVVFAGQSGNGLNIDDGGSYDTPAHHLLLKGLTVRDIGPGGNNDGIKLSGVDDFRIEGCTVERWGTGGGSAIDMVGCHRGVIEGSVFRHAEDVMGNTGVQAKGGTSAVVVRRNRFENAGGRAVNLGGSTGLQFFRPPLEEWRDPFCEAKDIRVEGNTFVGSGAPVAFVGVDGSVVRFNTIYLPKRWAMRILQETTEAGFVASRNGEFTDNLVVFQSDQWSEGGVNLGPKVAPETFKFARNFWFCLDDPGRTQSLVRLPTKEAEGVYGEDPLFRDAEGGDFRLKPDSPAAKVGTEALPE
jgi:hypothetical protein